MSKKTKLSKKQIDEAIKDGVKFADHSNEVMLKLRHEEYLKSKKKSQNKLFNLFKNSHSIKEMKNWTIVQWIGFILFLPLPLILQGSVSNFILVLTSFIGLLLMLRLFL